LIDWLTGVWFCLVQMWIQISMGRFQTFDMAILFSLYCTYLLIYIFFICILINEAYFNTIMLQKCLPSKLPKLATTGYKHIVFFVWIVVLSSNCSHMCIFELEKTRCKCVKKATSALFICTQDTYNDICVKEVTCVTGQNKRCITVYL
jgi:hypothetical protein